MKVIVVGATGLIGKEVVKALSSKHEVITVGHKNGDIRVDITSKSSIEDLFKRVGAFDALVSTAGSAATTSANARTFSVPRPIGFLL